MALSLFLPEFSYQHVNYCHSDGVRGNIGNSTVNAVPQANVVRLSLILKFDDMEKANWQTESECQESNLPASGVQYFR
jgi:hypothetical protein